MNNFRTEPYILSGDNFYVISDIKRELSLKPGIAKLKQLLQAAEFSDIIVCGDTTYYDLNAVKYTWANIIIESTRLGTKTLTYQGINYRWGRDY